jgi:hypothetical protein
MILIKGIESYPMEISHKTAHQSVTFEHIKS